MKPERGRIMSNHTVRALKGAVTFAFVMAVMGMPLVSSAQPLNGDVAQPSPLVQTDQDDALMRLRHMLNKGDVRLASNFSGCTKNSDCEDGEVCCVVSGMEATCIDREDCIGKEAGD